MISNNSLAKEKDKLIQEKCVQILTKLLKDEDNKYCVDCDGKSPRWASWNIGIFLCIRCAGIHRNLGVHISKVKSVNLDVWTPQQVACIEQMGNSRARAVYEANLPDTFRRPQNDSSLEKFIRSKYESKEYIAREWVQPPMPSPTWDIIIEKQLLKKREKKSSIGKISFPLPKTPVTKASSCSPKPLPKAPSSKSSPNQIQKLVQTNSNISESVEKKTDTMQDLLGLDTTTEEKKSTDPFGDFLSAPMPTTVDARDIKSNSDQLSEETSFFNQKQPDTSVAEKLSKDSIMALYSKTPNHAQQPILGGMKGLSSSLGQVNQNVSNRQPEFGGYHQNVSNRQPEFGGYHQNVSNKQPGFGGYHQNAMTFPQASAGGTPFVHGMVQNQLYNLGSVPSAAAPQMVPVVPVGFQLSAANPFSQMQSQMANMTMTGMNPASANMMGQNANTQFVVNMSAPSNNYLLEQNNPLTSNLLQ